MSAWTWDDEKRLGVDHMDKMAALHRRYEADWIESAERYVVLAEEQARQAAGFEQAAREIRAEAHAAIPQPAPWMPWCGVVTRSGMPCSRSVGREGWRCWQHAGPGGSS